MPNVNLQLNSSVFSPKFLPYLTDYTHRFEIYMGSAGSAKSYFITQKLIVRACSERIRILVCRAFATTLRNSAFSLFKEILKSWQIAAYVKINESDMRLTFPNGSEIIFLGLDSEQKLLSVNDIGCIFVEEATEVSRDIVEQLNLRLRGHNANLQLLMAFNPISKSHWLYDFWQNPPENSLLVHSTYKDNPFLSPDYVAALEELQTRNPSKWRVFGLGQWGVPSEGLVFSNWETTPLDPLALAGRGLEHRVGSDLGFVDPTAVVESFYDADNKVIYVTQEYYAPGKTLDEVLAAINAMGLAKSTIYFDSAEPRSIDFFKRAGINAKPCVKGQGSVGARIAFLQNHHIVISPQCPHLIAEFENFSYELNKRTGKYEEDKFTHEWSHAIDALGYAYSNIYTKSRLRTLDKAALGL